MGNTEKSKDVLGQDFLDQEELSLSSSGNVSCTTFNILAPIYKRLNSERCESEFRECWVTRNERILDRLLGLKSSIICLQEFWLGNEELVGMYEKRLNDAGYGTYKLARSNNRGDGLLTAVHRNHFQVLNSKELFLNDFGNRVAQLLHVELCMPVSQNQDINIEKGTLVVNTHLLFPHNSSYCLRRLRQVYNILQCIESYCEEYQLPPMPIILCGDWNGSKKGHVYKFLRSQGFVSSYDIAHHYTDSDEDAHKWVSHRNHRGNICGVDFVWLLNPNNNRKPLKQSFMEAILGNIKYCLHERLTEGTDSMHSLKIDQTHGSYITYSQFSQALTQLSVNSDPHDGLSTEDIKDLWNRLDADKTGIIDFSYFESKWNMQPLPHLIEEDSEEPEAWKKSMTNTSNTPITIGFNVESAVLFPPEVEKGMWPENYSLSDHAHLTVEFSPVRMRYS